MVRINDRHLIIDRPTRMKIAASVGVDCRSVERRLRGERLRSQALNTLIDNALRAHGLAPGGTL